MPTIHAAAITEIGRVRRANEDRFLCDTANGLFGVADGVGGLPYGARAAQTTLDSLREFFASPTRRSLDSVNDAIQHANRAVAQLGRSLSPDQGMGSTLTLGVLDDDFMILGHVGDSCCWQLRETEVRPLTTDHNVGRALAEHFVDHPLASDGSPLLRALSQCMGQPVPLRVDTIAHRLVPGTKLLFATDGVSGFLSEDEIARVFATDLSLPLQLSTLIDQVNERGAPDNATAVVLDIS